MSRHSKTTAWGACKPLILKVRTRAEDLEEKRIGVTRSFRWMSSKADSTKYRIAKVEWIVVGFTGVRADDRGRGVGSGGASPARPRGGHDGLASGPAARSRGPKVLSVDRQVQLIAGGMVLTGLALGTLVNPWFLAISAFFGAGLTFAGATGTCGLALVLLKMPWNRPRPVPSAGPAAVCAAGGGATATCTEQTDKRNSPCPASPPRRRSGTRRSRSSRASRALGDARVCAPPGPVRPGAPGPGAVRAGRHDPGECEQAPGVALRAGPRGAPAGRPVHSLPDRGPHARAALSPLVQMAGRAARGHAHAPRILACPGSQLVLTLPIETEEDYQPYPFQRGHPGKETSLERGE